MRLEILRKDLKNLRAWMAAAAASWLLLAIPLLIEPNRMNERMLIQLVAVLTAGVFSILTLQRMLHDDPVAGDGGFLATRPVSRSRVLWEKLLFAFVFLVVPGAIVRSAIYSTLAMGLPPAGYAILFGQEILFGATLIAVFLLPAIWTTSLPRMIIVIFAAFFALILASYGFSQFTSRPPMLAPSPVTITIAAAIVQLLIVACVIASAGLYLKTRSVLASAAIILLLVAATQTSWLPAFKAPPRDWPRLSETKSLRLEMTGLPWFQSLSENDRRWQNLNASVRLDGLQPSQVASPLLAHIVHTSGEKTGTTDVVQSIDSIPGIDLQRPSMALMGIPSHDSIPTFTIPLASGTRAEMEKLDSRSLSGSLEMMIFQPRVIAELPARIGATAIAGQFRIRVSGISFSDDSAQIDIAMESLNSPLLPFAGDEIGGLQLALAAGSSKDQMSWVESATIQSSSSLGAYVVRTIEVRFSQDEQKGSTHREFPRDGFLKLIAGYPLGVVSLPLPPITTARRP